jgi:hypothetical protein
MTTPLAVQITQRYLAELPEPITVARAANDYGRDTLCIDCLRTGRYVEGLQLIGQRLYHRIVTPPGTLRGSATLRIFGLGIERELGGTSLTGLSRGRTGQRVRTELESDRQVTSADVSVVEEVGADKRVTWRITCRVQSAAGPFELVVGVDENLNAELLGLRPLGRAA